MRQHTYTPQSTWPELGETFNWAIDWFDEIARGNDTPALVIIEEAAEVSGEAPASWSFEQLSRRSDQVGQWLSARGVGKGDSVIVMLGNQVELWESMLAIMKLGAVIMPTTTAVGPADLRDRIDRGAARFVIANAVDTAKFDGVDGDYTRIAVSDGGEAPQGWESFSAAYDLEPTPLVHPCISIATRDRSSLPFSRVCHKMAQAAACEFLSLQRQRTWTGSTKSGGRRPQIRMT